MLLEKLFWYAIVHTSNTINFMEHLCSYEIHVHDDSNQKAFGLAEQLDYHPLRTHKIYTHSQTD